MNPDTLYIVTFKGKSTFQFYFFSRYRQRSKKWYEDLEESFDKRFPNFTYDKKNITSIKRV